jgi:hypothetical protein
MACSLGDREAHGKPLVCARSRARSFKCFIGRGTRTPASAYRETILRLAGLVIASARAQLIRRRLTASESWSKVSRLRSGLNCSQPSIRSSSTTKRQAWRTLGRLHTPDTRSPHRFGGQARCSKGGLRGYFVRYMFSVVSNVESILPAEPVMADQIVITEKSSQAKDVRTAVDGRSSDHPWRRSYDRYRPISPDIAPLIRATCYLLRLTNERKLTGSAGPRRRG